MEYSCHRRTKFTAPLTGDVPPELQRTIASNRRKWASLPTRSTSTLSGESSLFKPPSSSSWGLGMLQEKVYDTRSLAPAQLCFAATVVDVHVCMYQRCGGGEGGHIITDAVRDRIPEMP